MLREAFSPEAALRKHRHIVRADASGIPLHKIMPARSRECLPTPVYECDYTSILTFINGEITTMCRISIILFLLAAVSANAGEIHTASANGDIAQVRAMLEANPALISSEDTMGATPLHWAVQSGNKDLVSYLIGEEVDLNARQKAGITPLMIAIGLGRADIVQILIKGGADVDQGDNSGRTPLVLARGLGRKTIVQCLIAAGAARYVPAATQPKTQTTASATGRSVVFTKSCVNGCPVNILDVDMKNPNVHLGIGLAKSGIGGSETFGSFVRRLQPTAAINGAFFCNNSLLPVGDIVVKGRLVHFGGMGTGMCITPDKKVDFIQAKRGRHTDWSGYETVLCGGPRLVTDGVVKVDARAEGFRDPHVLGTARRVAVGVTAANHLIMINTGKTVSLDELAWVMKDLGCVNAINFDGGSSIAMTYRGRVISRPGRSLTNVIAVYEQAGSEQVASR